MFEVGFFELALCAVVALLVFGPDRLPRVARETALWLRKIQSTVTSVKQEIQHELEMQDLKQSLAEQERQLRLVLSEKIAVDENDMVERKSTRNTVHAES